MGGRGGASWRRLGAPGHWPARLPHTCHPLMGPLPLCPPIGLSLLLLLLLLLLEPGLFLLFLLACFVFQSVSCTVI